VNISFHGAASCVTGSCHLLELDGFCLLVDCGLFQGADELFGGQADSFGFDPREIDAVLLTHAHLDHCGRLPLLFRQGFRGPIYSTAPTRLLSSIVLQDAAHLHEEARDRRLNHVRGVIHKRDDASYNLSDVIETMALFQTVTLKTPVKIHPDVTATFHDAGHILGSASIQVSVREKGVTTKILFSGDIGPRNVSLVKPWSPPADSDYVLVETTYGDRLHRSRPESIEELARVLAQTLSGGGNVLIPTFALERAQELLWVFGTFFREGRVPPGTSFFLDSPMALSATEVFERFRSELSPELETFISQGVDPFSFPGLVTARSIHDSQAINAVRRDAVIMAGSGMVSGGRIVYHLERHIDNPLSSLIFVGYQAEGTLGRAIVNGEKQVRLLGEMRDVRIQTHMINGFSAHADQGDLLAWCSTMQVPDQVFLIHGEKRSMTGFSEKLPSIGWSKMAMPKLHETIELPPAKGKRS